MTHQVKGFCIRIYSKSETSAVPRDFLACNSGWHSYFVLFFTAHRGQDSNPGRAVYRGMDTDHKTTTPPGLLIQLAKQFFKPMRIPRDILIFSWENAKFSALVGTALSQSWTLSCGMFSSFFFHPSSVSLETILSVDGCAWGFIISWISPHL